MEHGTVLTNSKTFHAHGSYLKMGALNIFKLFGFLSQDT